ncbi:MAG: glycosyltransferase [Cyclobacteriaceae bacterium]
MIFYLSSLYIIELGCLLLVILILLALILIQRQSDKIKLPNQFPFVTILLAVRNEENDILNCLTYLSQLDYPKEKIEVLIGDDDSIDNTSSICERFCIENSHFKYTHITTQLDTAIAKANVLAHLAKKAKGEYFLITDADIKVPKNWVKTMLSLSNHYKTDMVCGVTTVTQSSFSNSLQAIDWIYAQAMLKCVSSLKIPITGIGNNMLISKEAYFSTGGYENLPPTVTEDFSIYQAIKKNGYSCHTSFENHSLLHTKGKKDFKSVITQRRRWMQGALKLNKLLVIVLFLQTTYYPAILLFSFINFHLSISLFCIKAALQAYFIARNMKRIQVNVPVKALLLFELYSLSLSITLLFSYFFTKKIKWKGRTFL